MPLDPPGFGFSVFRLPYIVAGLSIRSKSAILHKTAPLLLQQHKIGCLHRQ